MSNPTCPCDGHLKQYSEKTGTEHMFEGVRHVTLECEVCGHLTFSPRLQQKDLDNYYSNSETLEGKYQYYKVDYGNQAIIDWVTQIKNLYIDLYREGRDTSNIRVFDAGCGNGNKVDAFRRINVDAWGADIGGMQVASGIHAGNNYIVEGDLLEILEEKQKEKPFDFVMMFHVLEHIADSEGFLRKLKNILNPNTALFVALPSATYLGAYSSPLAQYPWYTFPAHVDLFSPKSFCYFAEKCGWRINSIKAGSRPDPFQEQTFQALFGTSGEKLHNPYIMTDFLKENLLSADFWSFLSISEDNIGEIKEAEINKAMTLDMSLLRAIRSKNC